MQNTYGNKSGKHLPSIQETIEKALSQIVQEKVKIIGSGRTDAGVHAQAQVANFHTKTRLKLENLQRALNSLLPDDIVITDIDEVDEKFHARYSAKWKFYRYTIVNQQFPDVFYHLTAYHVPYKLNIQAIRQAVKYLIGRHDFSAFQGQGAKGKPAVRTLKSIKIHSSITPKAQFNVKISHPGYLIYIDLIADGFFHNMARRIVGLLLEVGRGKIEPIRVKEILELKDRSRGGPTVPARGLCLMRVEY